MNIKLREFIKFRSDKEEEKYFFKKWLIVRLVNKTFIFQTKKKERFNYVNWLPVADLPYSTLGVQFRVEGEVC